MVISQKVNHLLENNHIFPRPHTTDKSTDRLRRSSSEVDVNLTVLIHRQGPVSVSVHHLVHMSEFPRWSNPSVTKSRIFAPSCLYFRMSLLLSTSLCLQVCLCSFFRCSVSDRHISAGRHEWAHSLVAQGQKGGKVNFLVLTKRNNVNQSNNTSLTHEVACTETARCVEWCVNLRELGGRDNSHDVSEW